MKRLARLAIAVVLCTASWIGITAKASAASSALQVGAVPGSQPAKGDSVRGEMLFTKKCNMCHSKVAAFGPLMEDLYKRPKLTSGQPVNDQTVADKIMNAGGDKMPAFRYTLSQQDLADLLTYLREGKCCPDPERPLVNPRYRYR